MTRLELEAQFDRFVFAGYRLPDPDQMSAMFEEWFAALERYDSVRVVAAVTRMIRTRASAFWPTLADVLEAVRIEGAGHEMPIRGCPTCHGTTWVEAPPYRANGGMVYQGVCRCPECGVPAPRVESLARVQTPLTGVELRDWAMAQHEAAPPLTRDEMLASIAAFRGRLRVMPASRKV